MTPRVDVFDMRKNLLRAFLITSLVFVSASPAAADDDEGEIELLTEETATVTAGDTAWLVLNWTAEDGPVTDVALTLRKDPGKGVVVTYPTNTATFTGLMNGHILDEGEIDFTAIRVYVPSDFDPKKVKLDFEVSYMSGGELETDKVKVDVPVVQFTDGEHLVQHESAATVALGESTWVDVDMTGLAPSVDDIRLTVSGDLPVVYPSDRTFTSLHGDETLEDGETDTARVRIDALDVAAGDYTLDTELTYEFDGRTHSRTGTIEVTVAG